jgi:hypothetical protein
MNEKPWRFTIAMLPNELQRAINLELGRASKSLRRGFPNAALRHYQRVWRLWEYGFEKFGRRPPPPRGVFGDEEV